MTKELRKFWTSKNGAELLIQKKAGEWYIPLGTINADILHELRDATADACAELDLQPSTKL